MKTVLTIVLLLGASCICTAQDENVVVGKVLENGTVQTEVSKKHLFRAIESIYPIPHEHYSAWFKVKFSEGPRRYLLCEVDTFIVAYECSQVGDNIIIRSEGTTHLGTSDNCRNPEFRFAGNGEIVGTICGDKRYDGPIRTCNHSIKTPQTDIVAAIEKQKRSTD